MPVQPGVRTVGELWNQPTDAKSEEQNQARKGMIAKLAQANQRKR